MLLVRSFIVLVSVACAACGAASSAPPPVVVPVSAGPPSQSDGPSDSDSEAPSKRASKNADAGSRAKTPPGSALENPIETCGAREGYELVANYRCDDGSTPLGGDPRAGARARQGSSGSHLPHEPLDFANSHIVDIYEVPCPRGPVTLYVCLYHCPAGKSPF